MKIGVVSRLDMEESVQLTEEIVDFLLSRNIETLLDKSLVEHLDKYHNISCPLEEMDAVYSAVDNGAIHEAETGADLG